MKSLLSKSLLSLVAAVLFVGCAALKTSSTPSSNVIQASIDLVGIEDDKVEITITPPPMKVESTVFYIPQIVPGTYEYSNFGRFVEDVKAFDKKGNEIVEEFFINQ